MLFVSTTFLFLFLPCVLTTYYLLKRRRYAQNVLLFVVSIIFYAWGEPKFVIVLLASILCNWLLALIAYHHQKNRLAIKIVILIAVCLNIGLLIIYKYLDFFITQVNLIGHKSIPLRGITLPIGISFFTFQALSYVIDVARGEEPQKNPLYVGLYISFFPQLIAGPIVRYNTIANQIVNRKETISGFKSGSIRFMQGFVKKVLLANSMAAIADRAFGINPEELSVSFAWLGAVCYTLQIYFDFSGYSDMAIGLGRMFGFEFEENFNYPYIASSVTDFWRRWHISLSTWFRDYVYIPLGGNRTGSQFRNYLNLFVVWLLTGIWHGANWTFISWGLLYFVFLWLEKSTPLGKCLKSNSIFGRVYTLTVVNFLWVIFRSDSINKALSYIRVMLGLTHNENYTGLTGIYIKENWIFIIFAVLISINSINLIKQTAKSWLRGIKNWNIAVNVMHGLEEMALVFVFFISVIYIINGTYNPFIYFNF